MPRVPVANLPNVCTQIIGSTILLFVLFQFAKNQQSGMLNVTAAYLQFIKYFCHNFRHWDYVLWIRSGGLITVNILFLKWLMVGEV